MLCVSDFAFSWFNKSICIIYGSNLDNKSIIVWIFEFNDNMISARVRWFSKKSFRANSFDSSFLSFEALDWISDFHPAPQSKVSSEMGQTK